MEVAFWLEFFGAKDFLPNDWLVKWIAGTLCYDVPFACADIVFLLAGWDVGNLNSSRMNLIMDNTPAGTSVRNMLHWTQGVTEGKFQMFDYGYLGNMAFYNSPTPPQYQPQNFTSPPIALFTGSKDILADLADIHHLVDVLPTSNKPIVNHNEPTYNHLDFVWGLNACQKIYPSVLQLARKYARLV